MVSQIPVIQKVRSNEQYNQMLEYIRHIRFLQRQFELARERMEEAERMNEELNDDVAALEREVDDLTEDYNRDVGRLEREANDLCAIIVWCTIYWSVFLFGAWLGYYHI